MKKISNYSDDFSSYVDNLKEATEMALHIDDAEYVEYSIVSMRSDRDDAYVEYTCRKSQEIYDLCISAVVDVARELMYYTSKKDIDCRICVDVQAFDCEGNDVTTDELIHKMNDIAVISFTMTSDHDEEDEEDEEDETYFIKSDKKWWKAEYDEMGNEIYYENSESKNGEDEE